MGDGGNALQWTSVSIHQKTRRNTQEDCYLYSRRENL